MRIKCGFASNTTVAMLLVLGANALPAQSTFAASAPSVGAGSRPEFRAVMLEKSSDIFADPSASAFNAPLPPPPQLSRKKAIVLGVVIGGVVGGTAGYLLGKDSCSSCDDSGSRVVASSLGAVAGAALGGFVAAQNSPADVARSSLRPAAARFMGLPRPIVQYHVAVFR